MCWIGMWLFCRGESFRGESKRARNSERSELGAGERKRARMLASPASFVLVQASSNIASFMLLHPSSLLF